MIRRALKALGATCLHAAGADRLAGSLSGVGQEPLVVCYHRVVEDVRHHPLSAPAMLVSVRVLQEQLDWIGSRYRFVGLDELAAALEEGRRFPSPVAAVTFDDGYADVYHRAYPLLARKGIPAAFFVVSGLVGEMALATHDRLFALLHLATREISSGDLGDLLEAHGLQRPDAGGPLSRIAGMTEPILRHTPRGQVDSLLRDLAERVELPAEIAEELRPLTWSMLQELSSAGMLVGSHTHTHRVLPNEPVKDIVEELARSKALLEERLGVDVHHLAYPDGQHSPFCIEAAALAGYRYAYTTCPHRSGQRPLLTIPRRILWEQSSAGLGGRFSPSLIACQAHGVFDLVRPCRVSHGPRPQPWAAARRRGFA